MVPGDDEIGLGGHGQAAVGRDHRDATAAERAGERQLGQALGQRHDRGDGHRGRAADEDVDPQRLAAADRRGMVHADPAVDLVVQPDLAVRLVLVAGELDAVHPQVGRRQAGPVGVLGVDLRQGDERPAVHRPALDLGQLVERRSGAPGSAPISTRRGRSRQSVRGTPRYRQGLRREGAGIGLQLDQPARPRRACRGTGTAIARACRTGCPAAGTPSPCARRKSSAGPPAW